jgi:hypothetical protein
MTLTYSFVYLLTPCTFDAEINSEYLELTSRRITYVFK